MQGLHVSRGGGGCKQRIQFDQPWEAGVFSYATAVTNKHRYLIVEIPQGEMPQNFREMDNFVLG